MVELVEVATSVVVEFYGMVALMVVVTAIGEIGDDSREWFLFVVFIRHDQSHGGMCE